MGEVTLYCSAHCNISNGITLYVFQDSNNNFDITQIAFPINLMWISYKPRSYGGSFLYLRKENCILSCDIRLDLLPIHRQESSL